MVKGLESDDRGRLRDNPGEVHIYPPMPSQGLPSLVTGQALRDI